MSLQIVVGAQWGDEGKGRIVDWAASQADYCARFNGGDNAGHTVTVGKVVHKLHLVPSGIVHPGVVAVLGNGMVVNPGRLLEEMTSLKQAGIEVGSDRLRLSFAAHLITPAHQALDKALESARGKGSLGTTGRGIGPAYADKSSRDGLRAGDMLSVDFAAKVKEHVSRVNQTLHTLGAEPLAAAPICDQFMAYADQLRSHITDTSFELRTALKNGKRVLAEGAQGTLLDLDFGTYPFVTSSSTTAPAALTGLGLGLDVLSSGCRVTGVVKAFQTRVGSGPFPTEVSGDLALRLRGSGANAWDEYGTTTGRPRRVGWLDGVLLEYAVHINGINELAVTKVDILGGFTSLRLCTAYRKNGKLLTSLPLGPSDITGVEPVYEEFDGWQEHVGNVRQWQQLPRQTRSYLERIAAMCAVPIRLISVGPERDQIIQIN